MVQFKLAKTYFIPNLISIHKGQNVIGFRLQNCEIKDLFSFPFFKLSLNFFAFFMVLLSLIKVLSVFFRFV